jgi:Domain of Unknown Function (DUF1259).
MRIREISSRPAILLMAGLSLCLVLVGCETKEKEGAQDEEGTASPAPAKQANQADSAQAQAQASVAPIDWNEVAEALGRAGALQPGGVYKVGMPRGDLHVTIGRVQVKPALALGSWVGFKQTGPNEVTAMGDLVLLESEVGPVTSKLQDGGIEQTAIHNHLRGETPRVIYVHIRGQGDPTKVAAAIHAALTMTKTPMNPAAAKAASLPLDTTGSAGFSGAPERGAAGCIR